MHPKNNFGFTLIEIIASLVLLGIIAIVISLGFTRTIQEYRFTQDNAALTQKAQVALNRMLIELSYYNSSGTTATFNTTEFTFPSNVGTNANITFKLNNGKLTYKDTSVDNTERTLCDEVSALKFEPTWVNGLLQNVNVSMTLLGMNGVAESFSYTITIKNINN